jgi:glycosyltransferase involved in cell wall biosynthesis
MNCLIITPHRLGIPEMAQRIGREWKSLGHNVEYILADGAAAQLGSITIGAPGIALWWYKTLKHIASDHQEYDLIWTHQPIMPRLPTTDRTFWNKVIATIHTTLGREYELTLEGIYPRKLIPYYWFVKTIESQSYQALTNLDYSGPRYTVVSPHLRQEIEPFGIDDATYIPNGVFTPKQESFVPIRNEYGIPPDATVVFNIGSLTPQKRADTFAQCMDKVTHSLNDVFVIMAGDGPLREDIESYSSEYLRVPGYISDDEKWRWFADADIFASLSAYEGMPVATAEALSFDLPTILSDIPAHRHLVESYGPTAKLVKNDVGEIIDAIINLRGAKSDVELPNWPEVAKKYIGLLN